MLTLEDRRTITSPDIDMELEIAGRKADHEERVSAESEERHRQRLATEARGTPNQTRRGSGAATPPGRE